jgi:NADH-quinone oxidoreductase subunit J
MSVKSLIIAAAVALLAVLLVGRVDAQPAPGRPATRDVPVEVIDAKDVRKPPAAAPAAQPVAAQPAEPGKPARPKDRDKTEGTGGALALLFWAFALGSVGGSIFVITRRNLIAAVMGMVGTFFAVAGLYMMLYASFLAVIQMLVYAGAIMVLFVFVVMVLNKPEDEPWGLVGLPGKALAGLAMLYLTFRLGQTLWNVKPPPAAKEAPAAIDVDPEPSRDIKKRDPETGGERVVGVDMNVDMAEWGSTKAVGDNLFQEYLFPFEAVSILLLVGVVGAIAVARPLKDDEVEDAADAAEAAQS